MEQLQKYLEAKMKGLAFILLGIGKIKTSYFDHYCNPLYTSSTVVLVQDVQMQETKVGASDCVQVCPLDKHPVCALKLQPAQKGKLHQFDNECLMDLAICQDAKASTVSKCLSLYSSCTIFSFLFPMISFRMDSLEHEDGLSV